MREDREGRGRVGRGGVGRGGVGREGRERGRDNNKYVFAIKSLKRPSYIYHVKTSYTSCTIRTFYLWTALLVVLV